jgi:hypothetical protein
MIYSETFPKKNQQKQSFSTIISAVYLCCSLILLQCPLLVNRHPQDGTIAPLAVLLPPPLPPNKTLPSDTSVEVGLDFCRTFVSHTHTHTHAITDLLLLLLLLMYSRFNDLVLALAKVVNDH